MSRSVLNFAGERTDPVNNTYSPGKGYRTANPRLMRFNCPDSLSPFGAGGINPYAYCSNDPVNRRDPSGHHSTLGWIGIATGLALGILLTPVSGGSFLAVALSAVSVVAMAESTALAVSQQFVEEYNPELAAQLGWASLGFGLFSGVSSAALYRVASRPKSLFNLLRASLTRGKTPINLHPNNAAPLQFYKGASVEPIYTDGRVTSTLTTGFTSDFNGRGEPGLVAHTERANRLMLNFGKITVRNGADVSRVANKHTVESVVDYFKNLNIDLRNISRDKPLHLSACCVGGSDGAAQRLADVMQRPVIAYGNSKRVFSDGLYPIGNGRATDSLGVQFDPIRYEPRYLNTDVQLSQ